MSLVEIARWKWRRFTRTKSCCFSCHFWASLMVCRDQIATANCNVASQLGLQIFQKRSFFCNFSLSSSSFLMRFFFPPVGPFCCCYFAEVSWGSGRLVRMEDIEFGDEVVNTGWTSGSDRVVLCVKGPSP